VDRQQDASGDYGYDLAHEAVERPATPVERDQDEDRQPPDDARTAPDGDFGYDEAHDF